MNISKLKPIPKYIVNLIRNKDKVNCPAQTGHTRYYSYLSTVDGELVKITVAVKNTKNKWRYKQVAVHGIDSKACYVKDMDYYFLGGYVTHWYEQDTQTICITDWFACEDKYFNPCSININNNYALKKPKFKYSALNLYKGDKVLKYLRIYRQFKEIEYLCKMGFTEKYLFSKTILQACKTKSFCKWLFKNKDEILKRYYDVSIIVKAFKRNLELSTLQYKADVSKHYYNDYHFKTLYKDYKSEILKLDKYLNKQNIKTNLYVDYINACKYLGIDISLNKNKYPHDFMLWHDTRINEMHSLIVQKEQEEKEKFLAQFGNVSQKFLPLQKDNGTYTALIAKNPDELYQEGKALEHCVGKMGYDIKFSQEKSLIFFIRLSALPNTPLVTMEYSPSLHKVLQCYAFNNSTPNDAILNFVYKVWLPFANRQMKKINLKGESL